MRIALIIIGSILAFLLVLFLVAIISMYAMIYHSPKKWQLDDRNLKESVIYQNYEPKIKEMIDYLMAIPFKNIYIKSFDNKNLRAKLYINEQSRKVAILCHGYRGTSYRDFCGGAREFIDMGYNVILIDERAHDSSAGHSITFGVKERKDVLKWIDFANERFNNPELVLVGISMGAATVLNISNQIDNDIKIVADCPYASIKELFIHHTRALKLPVFIIYPLLWISALFFAHANINDFDNYRSIKESANPILIIHGTADKVVPYQMSQRLYETYQDKIQYALFEGAEHGESYLADKQRYQDVVKHFLEKK